MKFFNKIKLAYRFIKRAYKGYRKKITLLIFVGFLGAFLEGIGVNALIPFLSFITGKGEGDDVISKFIIDSFSYLGIDFRIRYLLILIAVLFLLKAAALIFSNYIKIKIKADYAMQNRKNLFSKTLDATWPFLSKQKLGHLEVNLLTNINKSAVLLSQISNIIMLTTSLLVYFIIALNINFKITLGVIIASIFFILVFRPLIYKTKLLSKEEEQYNKKFSNFINENVLGLKVLKAINVKKELNKVAHVIFKNLRNLQIKIGVLKNILNSVMEPIAFIFIIGIFALTYSMPNFNFAASAAVIYLIYRIFTYAGQFQTQLHGINNNLPYLITILDYRDDVIKNREKNSGDKLFNFNESFVFEKVEFFYDSNIKVIQDISFEIEKGQMVGLIGSSGSGKTTIVDLILRLFDLKKGKILLDGVDIMEIDLDSWRENIGYVSQDIFLINDTFENNIRFYDNSITKEAVIEAAKAAHIYDVIKNYSKGFNTLIGERGVMLSAGQRQRLALARVLARKPKILILDEATSSLDSESELVIQKSIEYLRGKITILAIAHRLSTIEDSDKVLVIEKGKILEEGSPKEMLKNKDSYFYKMYNIRNKNNRL